MSFVLFLQKHIHFLVGSHEYDILTMNPHIKCSHAAAYNPERINLLEIEWTNELIKCYPISAKTKSSCGSNGNSDAKSVAKTAVTVSAFWNQTASKRNIVAPQTAAKNPRQ